MKCIMLMFDSLNRHLLPPYNGDTPVHAPNFARLARRTAMFNRSYVCSMPCMPTRRDLHTGRPNFLHCGWGPIEPFDDSVPSMLSAAGVYTHLASDHYHYWEDGGATYHNRYDSWECFRGQEGDPFIGQVADPPIPENINGKSQRSDWINRQHQRREEDLPQSQTIEAGLRFIERNADQDNWFLQIECFDPHEPFVSNRRYTDLYPSDYDGPLLDWPGYREVTETPEQVDQARRNYYALMSKCDRSVGDVLDAMDRHGLWEQTMLIVWTDHGFMLGEHDCWAKNWMPLYEEVSHTPLFIWDPRASRGDQTIAGGQRDALVQPGIDLGPTLLGLFGVEPTQPMRGHDLAGVIAGDQPVRDAAIFGYHGDRINITDGRYVYYRSPRGEARANHYTLMPTAMRGFKGRIEQAELAPPFGFTRGMPVLKLPRNSRTARTADGASDDLLFDLHNDPQQQRPLEDGAVKERLAARMAALMAECEAPPEQFERMGLDAPIDA